MLPFQEDWRVGAEAYYNLKAMQAEVETTRSVVLSRKVRQVRDQKYAAFIITGPTKWVIATKFKPITKLYQIKEYQFKMDSRFLQNKRGRKESFQNTS